MLKLGWIVNPYAGIGGAEALKGSDNTAERDQLLMSGVQLRAAQRAQQFLTALLAANLDLQFVTWGGSMGADYLASARIDAQTVGVSSVPSTAEDTITAALTIAESGVDLLIFVGGDGTARNVFDAIGTQLPALGLPSGVKMQSGCFAVTPTAAAEVIKGLHAADLVDLRLQEVRDLDEKAYREGVVKSRYYGELNVPEIGQFVQATKVGGVEVEALVLDEISAELTELFEPDALWIIGPGTTTRAFMDYNHLDNTLLGVDVVQCGEVVALDVTASQLLTLIDDWQGEVHVLVTAIGGQGHVFGRGNQQFSPEVLRRVGKAAVTVAMTKTKLVGLANRPLIMDSNDPDLDSEWSGLIPVITGYRDHVLYPFNDGLISQSTQQGS
ncbi:ATP-NAD kinase family protein [uncultured Umboniibacter sp.]|uniref:ATP-NAD kinase family protein n=1 Tax=uncultured Umboniibacter sp. TaxID=1798917 RepID=UPI002603610A|nr:ATP-NAD kinase family protein [uncultured Umboniibacter sp.]